MLRTVKRFSGCVLVWASLTISRQPHRLTLLPCSPVHHSPSASLFPKIYTRIRIQSLTWFARIHFDARKKHDIISILFDFPRHSQIQRTSTSTRAYYAHTHTHTFSTFTHWVNTQVNSIPFHGMAWHFPTLKCINYLSENQYIQTLRRPHTLPENWESNNQKLCSIHTYIFVCVLCAVRYEYGGACDIYISNESSNFSSQTKTFKRLCSIIIHWHFNKFRLVHRPMTSLPVC